MFGSVYLKNFRCFDETSVSLKNKRGSFKQQVSVFGENSSGKTSFLLAFGFLRRLTDGYRVNDIYRTRTHFRHTPKVDPFDLKREVAKHYRKLACEDMVLAFEVSIKNQIFVYTVQFDNSHNLIQESLMKRVNNKENIIYKADCAGVVFGRSMVLVRDIDTINAFHKKSFGEYTMLSILNYICYEHKDIVFKSTLSDFIEYIAHMRVVIPNHYMQLDFHNFVWNSNISVFGGRADIELKQFILSSLPVLNNTIKSIFPLVDSVDYTFVEIEPNLWQYDLVVSKRTDLGIVSVPANELPAGLTHVLSMSISFVELMLGNTVIYDQFDHYLHQMPMLNIIENIVSKFSGQSILTLDSLDTMNHLEPPSVYVTNIKDYKFTVTGIEEISPTQPNHNVRSRYESGVYGHPLKTEPNTLYVLIDDYTKVVRWTRTKNNY